MTKRNHAKMQSTLLEIRSKYFGRTKKMPWRASIHVVRQRPWFYKAERHEGLIHFTLFYWVTLAGMLTRAWAGLIVLGIYRTKQYWKRGHFAFIL